jgi:hypothetical protein
VHIAQLGCEFLELGFGNGSGAPSVRLDGITNGASRLLVTASHLVAGARPGGPHQLKKNEFPQIVEKFGVLLLFI